MKEHKEIPDKWLLLPVILLILHLVYRLADQAKMMFYFALDFNNDVSSYMAQLHFLKECGFHQLCQYWYNGFITFKFSPPGWYFLNYPLYLLFNDVKIATYISIVIMLAVGLLLSYKLRKLGELSKIKGIMFFALFFGSAIGIGGFVRLGRVNELLSWVLFIILFFMLYYYRDKKIDKKFYITTLIYAAIILSYHSTAVLASLTWLGFLLTRRSKSEVIKTIIAGALSLALAAFWLAPFAINLFKESVIPHLKQGEWAWSLHRADLYTNIAMIIIPLAAIILFHFYYKSKNKSRTELLFFIPTIILSLLFFVRATPLLPVLNQIFPDPIINFVMFNAIFLLLKIDINILNKTNLALLKYGITIIAIASITINAVHTPLFAEPNEIQKEFTEYLPYLNERFIMVGTYPEGPFPKAFYSYAATLNKNSISGWYPEEKNQEYMQRLDGVYKSFNENNCEKFRNELIYFNTTEVLARKEFCPRLESCGLKKEVEKENSCLYNLS